MMDFAEYCRMMIPGITDDQIQTILEIGIYHANSGMRGGPYELIDLIANQQKRLSIEELREIAGLKG